MKVKFMKYSKSITLLLTMVLVVGLFSGCFSNSSSSSQTSVAVEEEKADNGAEMSESQKFDLFLEDLARRALEDSPLTATFTLGDLEANGLMELAGELDHIDLEEYQESLVEMEADLETLHSFNFEELSDNQKINYQLAEFNLDTNVNSGEFLYVEHLIQPSAGVQVNFPLTLMQIELESINELEAFILRVKEMPRLFDEVITYEQERFELGYALPGNLYDEVVEQIDSMLGQPEEFMMYLSFVDRVDALDELNDEEKDGYKAEYLGIIADEIFPAFERLKVQAATMNTSSNTGSISEWADGQAYYEAVVDYKTSGELDVKGLEEWAGAQLVELTSEFQTLVAEYPDLMTMDLMSVLPEYESMDEVYAIVDEVYKTEFMDYGTELASENVIPSYLEEHLAAGFYFPVTVDGEDYGNMFLQADTYDNITADTVMLYYHENIPGHHLYYSYIADSKQPLYRKMNEYLPYEEGWATYVQNACFDHMDLPEGVPEFFALNSSYSNAFMVLLDINFHYHGLSEEEVKDELLMMGYDDETSDSVITRMISKPGEMIHYMYGEFKMQEFHDQFMEAAGDQYSDKTFHDFILKNYGLPFYVVEDELNKLTF